MIWIGIILLSQRWLSITIIFAKSLQLKTPTSIANLFHIKKLYRLM